jgi:DNA mismatch repair protein PMS2
MFFVNSRPCALPQVAKAINEVYRSYNITQSPFIFANLKLDTNAYDVNVSPDKRTILLHDQNALLEALKSNLTELFDAHEQSVPQAQLSNKKFPVYKPLTITRQLPEDDITSKITAPTTRHSTASREEVEEVESSPVSDLDIPPASIVRKFAVRNTITREDADKRSKRLRPTIVNKVSVEEQQPAEDDRTEGTQLLNTAHSISTPVRDFNERLGVRTGTTDVNAHRENKNDCTESEEEDTTSSDEENPPLLGHDEAENAYASGKTAQASNEIVRESHRKRSHHEDPIPSTSPNLKVANTGGLPNAFQRLRRPRASEDTATITIGNTTTVATLGTPSKRARIDVARVSGDPMTPANPVLLKSLRGFAAAGSQLGDVQMDDIDLISPQSDEVRTNDFHPIVPKLKKFPSAIILNSSDLVQAEDDEDDEDDEDEGSEELEPVASRDDNSDGDNTSDEEYVDETVKKVREEVKVAKMIANAEVAARPSEANVKRATSVLKARSRKDATLQLLKKQDASASSIASTLSLLREKLTKLEEPYDNGRNSPGKTVDQDSVEERLALSVSKADFARMEIIGQFNLGFILATRPAELRATQSNGPEKNKSSDELFIIDQHASDEKYNFERLQVETVVQNQRLVHAKSLDLTAVEEELILNHPEALTKNGFVVNVDQSGDKAVGRRAQLVSLPMSKEVIFDSHDLEELLALLADQAGSAVPRPSKVRRMFAMRACRSSIMVGKTLTVKQMQNVVKHMGEIDKPWNCPHGRPTMRHLIGLDSWQSWEEGSGLAGLDETVAERADWDEFIRQVRSERESEAGSEGMENAEDEGYL